MSFAGRLVHALAIVTPTTAADGELDSYGQPVPGEPTVVTCKGLIQPKSAREIPQANEAGAVIADHTIFLLRQTLSAAAYIRFDPDDNYRYEIIGVRDFDFGTSPHLEVDARRVVASTLEAS